MKKPKVILYGADWCRYCMEAKAYLKKHHVPFTVKEVDRERTNENALETQRKSGQRGVPVLDIGGRIVVGFDKPAIDKALSLLKRRGQKKSSVRRK